MEIIDKKDPIAVIWHTKSGTKPWDWPIQIFASFHLINYVIVGDTNTRLEEVKTYFIQSFLKVFYQLGYI